MKTKIIKDLKPISGIQKCEIFNHIIFVVDIPKSRRKNSKIAWDSDDAKEILFNYLYCDMSVKKCENFTYNRTFSNGSLAHATLLLYGVDCSKNIKNRGRLYDMDKSLVKKMINQVVDFRL